MDINQFIENKKKQAKTKFENTLLNLIELIINICSYSKTCVHCSKSYGININKLNCSFKIKPKEVTIENWNQFIDNYAEVEGLVGRRGDWLRRNNLIFIKKKGV